MLTVNSLNDTKAWARVLVRINHELGAETELTHACDLLDGARRALPHDEPHVWAARLAEAAGSLALRTKIATLTIDEALRLSRDGALLVAADRTGASAALLVHFAQGKSHVASEGIDSYEAINTAELSARLGTTPDAPHCTWLIIDAPEAVQRHEDAHEHLPPLRRLWRLWRPERSDMLVVAVFAFFVGLLALATPIAVESLVSTVAFGRYLQPVVVLSVLLFGFLGFGAAMRGLQTFVVEIIQRRLFVRVVADLAHRLPRIRHDAFDDEYGPEVVNRYFDVVTLQKVTASILLDGLEIMLATLVGMAVLAFYHPWLLGFDVFLLVSVLSGVFVMGRGAINTAIEESYQKYKIGAWLQDIVRCRIGFKLGAVPQFATDRANALTSLYLSWRSSHFRRLFRQIMFLLLLQAVAGTVLLGFGGWLVIQGQLTLGQLVAAELIVMMILSSVIKLGKHIEAFYDAIAAVDKLGHVLDLPLEPMDGRLHLEEDSPWALRATGVRHSAARSGKLATGFTEAIHTGEDVALLGGAGSGKSLLLDILFGLRNPTDGHVEIFQVDPRDFRPDALRRYVALARDVEIIHGSVLENVTLGRLDVTATDVREALLYVDLLDDILQLPRGLDTKLTPSGAPLSSTQQARLMLARALAGKPKLLLVDGLLDAFSDELATDIIRSFRSLAANATIIVATSRRSVAEHLDRIIELEDSAMKFSDSGAVLVEDAT